ncbi:MAG: anti-sigma factor family protein [Steroidobacteraceae bacterium]
MDLELHDEPIARSGDVEEPIRHLTHDDLEAYFEGRLPSARLNHCRTHLDSCEACRAELEDLRTLKSDMAGFSRAEPARREPGRARRRRRLTLPQAAAMGTIVVAAIAAALWWTWERPRANKTSVAMTVAHPLAAVPTAGTQTPDRGNANEIATLSPTSRPEPNKSFALLGPFGETIAETRPELRWQPLAGAIRYSVAIVDMGLHPVQRSRALRTTSWRPRRPLRRGQTYLWQVTATLRGGSKVVASSPEALLRIIPDQRDAIEPHGLQVSRR